MIVTPALGGVRTAACNSPAEVCPHRGPQPPPPHFRTGVECQRRERSRLRITVLGKSPSWQDVGGACSGYLRQEDDFALLLDCGNGLFSKLRRFCDYVDVDAVLVTHLHADHSLDLVPFSYALTYARVSNRYRSRDGRGRSLRRARRCGPRSGRRTRCGRSSAAGATRT